MTERSTSDELLTTIRERFDDIERAVLVPPGLISEQFVMVLDFMNGERQVIDADNAEIILNDGILNRMHVKIELAKA